MIFWNKIKNFRSRIASNRFCSNLILLLQVKVQCSQAAISGKKYGWKHDKDRGGGALATFGCHIIDLLVFLFEEQVNAISLNYLRLSVL